jgi:hypothetical protein
MILRCPCGGIGRFNGLFGGGLTAAVSHRGDTIGPSTMSETMESMEKPWKFWLVRAWMLAAISVYVLVALNRATPMDWSAPWIPDAGGRPGWFVFAAVGAVVSWADGWLIPWIHRRKPSSEPNSRQARWEYSAYGRFMMRVCVFHGGAIWGLVLSFQTRDARYSIVSAGISSLMILVLPQPRQPRPDISTG